MFSGAPSGYRRLLLGPCCSGDVSGFNRLILLWRRFGVHPTLLRQCLVGSAHRILFDASAPALSAGGPSVRPGTVPFMSCQAGAYGWLLLSTHERILTGGLVACDWLRPVTRGRGVWLLQSALRRTPLSADYAVVAVGGAYGSQDQFSFCC